MYILTVPSVLSFEVMALHLFVADLLKLSSVLNCACSSFSQQRTPLPNFILFGGATVHFFPFWNFCVVSEAVHGYCFNYFVNENVISIASTPNRSSFPSGYLDL